jgi:DNA-binding MarR family transcriptional regulator
MKKSFGNCISTIYRHLQIYINQEFTKYGFGSGQYLFYLQIARFDGICQKEISQNLKIDKATTAKAIKKLAGLGYVYEVQNIDDKRSYNLHLTQEGKELLPEIQKVLRSTTDVLQEGLNPSEIDETYKILNKMLQNITGEVEEKRKISE